MNLSLSEFKIAFSEITPAQRPVVNLVEIKDPNLIAGFAVVKCVFLFIFINHALAAYGLGQSPSPSH